jgi:signal peptidase I
MAPTLMPGDVLLANRLRFGPHVPFTKRDLPGYARPARGDVVLFAPPKQTMVVDAKIGEERVAFVKRIAGEPGDTLWMREGVLFVNGFAWLNEASSDRTRRDETEQPAATFAWQHGIETSTSAIGPPPNFPTLHNWGPLLVPAAHYFVLGDNRDDSIDSRHFGLIPRSDLRGRAMFLCGSYVPDPESTLIRAINSIRWTRLGRWVN